MNALSLKKHALGTALLTLGLLGTSCTKDYLELQPRNAASNETFYTTQTAALQATTAAYTQLQQAGFVNHALWIMDIMADNSTTGGGGGTDGIEFQQVDNFSIPPNNPTTTDLFQRAYLGIGAANQVLLHVPEIAVIDANIKTRSMGEAAFLRALYYFYLVRTYGDVPLVLTPPAGPAEASSLSRDPAAMVYAQIIIDLNDAIKNLPLPSTYTGEDIGRASKLSAMGLLAKVYLTQNDMTNAATQADATITAALADGKKLWPNYADNFKVANENGQESLFEVQFKSGLNLYILEGPGSAINEFWGARFFGNPYVVSSGGYGYNIPEKEFMDGYEAGDKRKAATVFVPGDLYTDGPLDNSGKVQVQPTSLQGSPNGYNIRKFYAGGLSTIWDSPLNVPILRLSEMYLIKAEAGGTGALAALNTVRSRAGLPPATNTSQATVLKERRYEFAFEMDRWYDLKRTKTLLTNPSLISKGIKSFNDLMPIPQAERDVNPNLTQNPGY
ncbi:RagB/SusD family nutrient uptake outer membrane protein [Hymenobacter coccineus]|uniref:Carbohydrate-binding protein SusD n=1 Tax=Hymenobacter coccineus TaxID=1908235 RepID=A0A1G1TLH8_9BACT|nr:RagB/SusD family nutrient uptake outer membrane protein [Hymenobacter coccineus]OGX91701.1 hypothetical protein BEN49_18885 [Hymenobacter coccineus]